VIGRVPPAVLAPIEVAGRHALSHFPGLRARVTKWVRRTPPRTDAIPLFELRDAISRLGNLRGTLLVHSAWDALRRVDAKPSTLLAMLRELIGPEGTLVMPTHPAASPVYDVARTPSSAGLLSESLRRSPGAVRSPSPFAPACAIGGWAADCGRDFREESSATPYGKGSPYWRVMQEEGHALFIGIDFIRVNTLVHVAFDLLGEENPISGYYEQRTHKAVRGDQSEEWQMWCPRPAMESFFASTAFKQMMIRAGLVHFGAVRGLSLALLAAGPFLRWHLPLARSKGLPYWGFHRATRSPRASQRA
jgi:aminoglycoside N3'-acetyltransferase